MKILVLGGEGYIGTALIPFLREKGHEVRSIDNCLREDNVRDIGSKSITPKEKRGSIFMNINDPDLFSKLKSFQPDTIINLAHQPSAPFSMRSAQDAMYTQHNNVLGTLNVLWAMKEVCPDAHLICLGTEGEYGADVWDGKHIPEGGSMSVGFYEKFRDDNTEGFEGWTIPTPRYAGSFYHWSKVFSDYNIDYATRVWGLTATNIQQGIVYSHRNGTRLDADTMFGTTVHRFVAQAVAGMPLTVHGTGGQTRGFICLQNSLEAIGLLAENPPEKGEFRVLHQTTEEHTVKSIAEKIQKLTGCEISYVDNPRVEKAENTFTFDTSTLDNLGLQKITLDEELPHLIEVVRENKDNIIKDVLTMDASPKWL